MYDEKDIMRKEFEQDRKLYEEREKKKEVKRMSEENAKAIPQVKEIAEGKNVSAKTGVELVHPLRLMGMMVEESNWCDLAVNVIASSCASTTPVFRITSKNKKRKTQIENLQDMLEFPNESQTGYQLFHQTYLDLATYGNAYWQVIKTRGGELHSFYTLPVETIRVIPIINKETYVLEYKYVQLNTTHVNIPEQLKYRVFEADEIVHFKRANQRSFMYGKPVFAPLMNQVAASISAQKAIAAWFEEGLTAGAIFRQDADPDTADRNRDYFNEVFSNPENFGKIMLLEGSVELVREGNKFKDLDFSKISDVQRDGILTTAGIPLSLAGVRSSAGNGNAEIISSEEKAFKRNTIDQYHNIVFSTLNSKLIRKILGWKDTVIEPGVLDKFNLTDAKSIVETLAKFGISLGEARDLLGMQRVPSDDANNMYFITTNNGSAPADVITGVDYHTGKRTMSLFEAQMEKKGDELTSGASGTGKEMKDAIEGK